jgi:hypothetical protein
VARGVTEHSTFAGDDIGTEQLVRQRRNNGGPIQRGKIIGKDERAFVGRVALAAEAHVTGTQIAAWIMAR